MNTTEFDDHDLIQHVANGDVRAFEVLYGRHRAQVFNVAMRVTGRRRAAEEATQDVFFSLWQTARSYDPSRGTITTWLLASVRNRSIDWIRREARHASNIEMNDALASRIPAGNDTAAEAAEHEAARDTRRLLTDLPAKQRQVIELAYFEQLTQREIATTIGVPLGTVKGRQRLALNRLRTALTPATDAPTLAIA